MRPYADYSMFRSTNVTLMNSWIDVADDGVCPKAVAGRPLRGLIVRNTTIRSKSHAIKFGSNTDSLMADILFDNCTIIDSNGGMSIQARGQGDIRNVTWSNMVVETRYQVIFLCAGLCCTSNVLPYELKPCSLLQHELKSSSFLQAERWWGNGDWVSITAQPRSPGDAIGNISNISFINVTARSENGGFISGLAHGVHGVLLENVHVIIAKWSNYSTGKGEFYAPCATDQGLKPCMGTRDYRPYDGHPGRVVAAADGLYLEHVFDAVLKNVTVEYELPRQTWFGACLTVDNITAAAGVHGSVKCINGPDPKKKI